MTPDLFQEENLNPRFNQIENIDIPPSYPKRSFKEFKNDTEEIIEEQLVVMKLKFDNFLQDFKNYSKKIDSKISDLYSKMTIFALAVDTLKNDLKKNKKKPANLNKNLKISGEEIGKVESGSDLEQEKSDDSEKNQGIFL